MSIKELIICYFSGTGNSRRVSRWVEEYAFPLKGNVLNMENITKSGLLSLKPDSVFGIVFPTHGFTAPWKVLKFVFGLPVGKGIIAFVIATRGSLAFGSFLLPGFAGSACFLISLILILKGYKIEGFRGVDMPSNWISLHPGLSKAGAEKILAKSHSQVRNFTGEILAFRYRILTISRLFEFIFALLLLPVSVLYLVIGHFLLAKLLYANYSCNGCGLCAENCPVNAIKMYGKRNPRPYWTFKCESCMRCLNYCPKKAVEASYPFAVAAGYIGSSAMLSILFYKTELKALWLSTIDNPLIYSAVKWIYFVLIFFLVYIVFYYLFRIPFINRILSIINPIHYYRRYNEPDTKLSDFRKDNIQS